MFAEAINSPSHLQRFVALATTAGFNATETVTDIERNIEWIAVKAPEIDLWVAGSAVYVKASILTVLAFIFVLLSK